MHVQHQIHERANQPRTHPAEDNEAGAADFCPTLEVDDSKFGANLPVRLDTSAVTGRTPASNNSVLVFSAGGNLIECDVRELEQDRRQLALGLSELAIEPSDLVTQQARLLLEVIRGFAGTLSLTYLLTDGVASGLPLLNCLDGLAPRFVESYRAVDGRRERIENSAPAHASSKCVDVLAHHPQVVHESARRYSSRE